MYAAAVALSVMFSYARMARPCRQSSFTGAPTGYVPQPADGGAQPMLYNHDTVTDNGMHTGSTV